MGTLFLGFLLWILPLIFFNIAIFLSSRCKRFLFLLLSIVSVFSFVVFVFLNKNPELFDHSVFYILFDIVFYIVAAVVAAGAVTGLVIIFAVALAFFLFEGAESLELKDDLIYPAIYLLATVFIIFR